MAPTFCWKILPEMLTSFSDTIPMSEQVKKLRIVVASPGDVLRECETVSKVLEELNKGVAADRGLLLEAIRWETDTYPGFHPEGPQGLIDPILRIEDSDVVIGIFWKRFGTPVKDAGSGAEHEFKLAYEGWRQKQQPEVMVYFNQKPYRPQSKEETDQWGRVLEFREAFPKEGLWWPYKKTTEFEWLLRTHLTNFLRSKFPIRARQSVLVSAIGATPIDSSKGLEFVSIGIHNSSDKYWHEGERSEHRSKISKKAAQYFHMTVFESGSDFWKEHLDPVNADPLFDITLKNEFGSSLIFRKVGIVISVVAHATYLWGIPTAVKIPVSADYVVKVPNLRERLQDAYDSHELKPKRLNEMVSIRVPDPYALEPEALFRYTLHLKNYCENIPNHARLQMWCETDHGEFRSGEIALLGY